MVYRVEIDQDECVSSGRCVADYPALVHQVAGLDALTTRAC